MKRKERKKMKKEYKYYEVTYGADGKYQTVKLVARSKREVLKKVSGDVFLIRELYLEIRYDDVYPLLASLPLDVYDYLTSVLSVTGAVDVESLLD